jgi:5-methylcytosine-specific restriction protein A
MEALRLAAVGRIILRTMRKPHYSGPWRTVRRQILERDSYICQIQTAGCLGHADQVDHIVPIARGGEWWNPDNLRAACRKCNNDRNRVALTKASRQW